MLCCCEGQLNTNSTFNSPIQFLTKFKIATKGIKKAANVAAEVPPVAAAVCGPAGLLLVLLVPPASTYHGDPSAPAPSQPLQL